jgi:hypothetical protein
VDLTPFRPTRFAEGQPIRPKYEYGSAAVDRAHSGGTV